MQVLRFIDLPMIALLLFIASCNDSSELAPISEPEMEEEVKEVEEIEGIDYFLPNISLDNWKVTLPVGNPTEVKPPEILDYATNPLLQEFMYNDSLDGSLVFYTYPGSSTTNSSYSRTELREQMVPGSNNVNWTFEEGGRMKGTLKMDEISRDQSGNYHRAIIMQIHGRLTDGQRDQIGEDDNNAPPVLKIYWNKEKIRVHRKVLKNTMVNEHDILFTDSWTDEAFWFDEVVGFEPFELEIIALKDKLEVILNGQQSMVFDDIHVERWAIFENYFKAGNYLVTNDEGAFCRVKYYDLEVHH